MARTKINKSAEVRKAMAAKPDASAKEIVAMLKAKKIKVTTASVYTARNNAKRKAGKPMANRGPKATKTSRSRVVQQNKLKATRVTGGKSLTTHSETFDGLLDAAQLINRFGGVDEAIAAVKLADKIRQA